MSFVQNTKSTSTLSANARTSDASLNQNNKTIGNNLWTSAMFPWQMTFPWMWDDNGQLITMQTRTNG
jgi:hypothetical protein